MNTSSLLVLLFCFSATFAAVPVAMNCPDGWKWFIRSRGGWCMKVRQFLTEILVKTVLKAELESQTKTSGYMWVGGKRIKPCLNSVLTTACSKVTSFYWTDKSTVGVQGFTWLAGEPNNAFKSQWCLQLMSNTGLMDDVS
ncbi:hypothetical protein B9Z55_007255 [Caenorhabditis nigoni]|nr:hypothetical protein B9Z55_007255 [Caenorhabditis nigoni]